MKILSEAEDLLEYFEERAGILEHDGGLSKTDAELEAARMTVTYAMNHGCLWSSLRMALYDYPEFIESIPQRTGTVDSLPLGVAKVGPSAHGKAAVPERLRTAAN